MERKFKTKHEYCHILDDKLVITQTLEIGDLVEDYAKSVNNVFKTLMVFFIGIPVFTALSFVFYNMEKPALSMNSGSFAFFFLIMAFYTMLFTSGTPVIKKESIYRIQIQKLFNNEVLVIIHKEAGRYKRRSFILEKEHIDEVVEMLLSEKLITDKDINHKGGLLTTLPFVIPVAFFYPNFLFLKDNEALMVYYGTIIAILGLVVLVGMLRKSISPFYYNTKKN